MIGRGFEINKFSDDSPVASFRDLVLAAGDRDYGLLAHGAILPTDPAHYGHAGGHVGKGRLAPPVDTRI
jgi:hypothetical protein